MKKVVQLCLLMVSLVLVTVSCSKDDAPVQIPVVVAPPSIVGTWEFSKKGTWDGTAGQNLQDYNHVCATRKDNWVFNAQANFSSFESGDCQDPVLESNYTYLIQDNVVTLTSTTGANTSRFTIVELTATGLKISGSRNSYFEFVRR